MGYELRTNTIEPRRQTFDTIVERFGEKAASRYQEGTYGMQPTENFHYRPFWAPQHELYDPDYTVLKLTDPYSYTDPRQYYYATYVASRAEDYDSFGRTLKYAEERNLLAGLPEQWLSLVISCYLPLRHYEAGAELISINGCRFAYGTSVSQAVAFAAFDRIGNAQVHSMIGLAVGEGSSNALDQAKQHWLESEHLQPLREYVEKALIEKDYAVGLMAIDLVDGQIFRLMHEYTDEHALTGGAGVVSLLGQHYTNWYADQCKWLDPLIKAWTGDPEAGEANAAALAQMIGERLEAATAAVAPIAVEIDKALGGTGAVEAAAAYRDAQIERYRGLGVPLEA
ncbi:MAG: hypothetical protein ACK5MT_10690 [Actinomycetales bacterium]